MYPINPAQDWDAAMLYLDANENQYNELMKHFIAEFEHNYSASKWIPELDKYLV
jgi:phytoene/squalene synthetase